jgi:hypothetical protein
VIPFRKGQHQKSAMRRSCIKVEQVLKSLQMGNMPAEDGDEIAKIF